METKRAKTEANILSKLKTLHSVLFMRRDINIPTHVIDDVKDIIRLVESLGQPHGNADIIDSLVQENFELQKELLNQALAFDELQKKSKKLLERNKQLQLKSEYTEYNSLSNPPDKSTIDARFSVINKRIDNLWDALDNFEPRT